MKKATRILALVLAMLMCLCLFAGCKDKDSDENSKNNTTPLVVGYSQFNEKFSPFFSETAYDQDVYAMTQISLLASDRTGAIIMNGIEGETHSYNGKDYTYKGLGNCEITRNDDGTVYYDIEIRDDVKFSDGEKLTIDDVIFTMYVLCDPTYDGASTLYAQPIQGIDEYRAGMTTLSKALAEAGRDNTNFDNWTEEQQTKFWDAFDNALVPFAQGIVDYCVEAGVCAEGDVASASAAWGFSGNSATVEEFAMEIGDNYGWNFTAMEAEVGNSDALADMMDEEVYAYSTVGVKTGDSAASISGIQKTGDYSMRIVMDKFDAVAIYQLAVAVAPMHYYGDASKYDYDNNQFGFEKGDLSSVRAKTTTPMGAGPYKFIEFKDGVVKFESNDSYFLGAPKIKNVNFQQCTTEGDKLNGVVTGTIDLTDPSINDDTIKAIKKENSNNKLTGDKITTDLVDNLGYGYIGICADNVKVGNDPSSDASKNLRKALATIYSVYRDVSIDSYYGEMASVINYPISNTSWAAPQATDAGYQIAFSVDVNGDPIYTSKMSADERYEAAKQAALGYLEAAGYTVENGKVTAAPAGASLEYEVLIPANGEGDHPSFMVLTEASKALADIGINLIVTDMSDSSALWDSLDAGEVDMWAAAWGATVDPDMYQVYHSSNQTGSNHYRIADAELDSLILEARTSDDQSFRKGMYKECLDIILDWAVEVPVYQRKNCIIWSTERVNSDTVTPDITPFYNWMSEIQNMELK